MSPHYLAELVASGENHRNGKNDERSFREIISERAGERIERKEEKHGKKHHADIMRRHRNAEYRDKRKHEQVSAERKKRRILEIIAYQLAGIICRLRPEDCIRAVGMEISLGGSEDIIDHDGKRAKNQQQRKRY